jgi:F0F1-type ATP synthase epsilon subunit
MADQSLTPSESPVQPTAQTAHADRPAFGLKVATFNEDLFDGPVTYVDLPGIAGHVGVLGRHTPLLTLLADGQLTLHPVDGPPRVLPVMGGIAEVGPWGVTVLADLAGHDAAAEQRRMAAARERSATRHAQQGDLLSGSAAARARLDDELKLFLVRALNELKR